MMVMYDQSLQLNSANRRARKARDERDEALAEVERLREALQDALAVAGRFTREVDLDTDERLARALQDLSVIRRAAARALERVHA